MSNHGKGAEDESRLRPDAWAKILAEAEADFQHPEHPDAIALWPVLFPVYDLSLFSADVLKGYFPTTERLLRRMASAIRDQMVDADLGLLGACPEHYVSRALVVRAGQGR